MEKVCCSMVMIVLNEGIFYYLVKGCYLGFKVYM